MLDSSQPVPSEELVPAGKDGRGGPVADPSADTPIVEESPAASSSVVEQPAPPEAAAPEGIAPEETAPLVEAVGRQPRRWGLRSLRLRFRHWRHSRPFWGGFWVILGSVMITYGPATAIRLIFVSGDVVWLGTLVGVLIGVLGLFLWFMPGHRHLYSVLAVLLALVSLITSDLGGFLVGMLLAVIGGSMAFAWTDDERFQRKESRHRIRRAARHLVPHRREAAVSGAH